MELLDVSTMNFTTPEASTNLTTSTFNQMGMLNICTLSFHFMLGLPTHSYVIWHIVTGRGNGIASEFFNLSLSVCEIVLCLNSLFTILTTRFPILSTLMQFLLGLGITGRPLFQCLMCVERYLAVVHPVTFLNLKPLRYRLICSFAAWIIIFGSCFFCMFIISVKFYIFMWFFSVQLLLFPSIQLFCCSAVLSALKQSGPGERGREREEENHIKRRAFYIILLITVSMVIIYIPSTVTGFYRVLTHQNIPILWMISQICFLMAGFVQPVLYLHRTGKLSCRCSP
ncbi:chemokine XC receptor 1-like [Myxocyprinus asiaticus]|uniref:chemokine XC receptor 1-like n=1 Tax=Myxocyprinus asiaticus TaxID=70543 RepID=UPI0022221B60|nr:chemokine XC receptor 1-like [Myxocyprinus asiaticus]